MVGTSATAPIALGIRRGVHPQLSTASIECCFLPILRSGERMPGYAITRHMLSATPVGTFHFLVRGHLSYVAETTAIALDTHAHKLVVGGSVFSDCWPSPLQLARSIGREGLEDSENRCYGFTLLLDFWICASGFTLSVFVSPNDTTSLTTTAMAIDKGTWESVLARSGPLRTKPRSTGITAFLPSYAHTQYICQCVSGHEQAVVKGLS